MYKNYLYPYVNLLSVNNGVERAGGFEMPIRSRMPHDLVDLHAALCVHTHTHDTAQLLNLVQL